MVVGNCNFKHTAFTDVEILGMSETAHTRTRYLRSDVVQSKFKNSVACHPITQIQTINNQEQLHQFEDDLAIPNG